MSNTVGRIVVYVTKTGLLETGLVKSVDANNNVSIRIFDSAPKVTMKENVPYSATPKPLTWHFKHDRVRSV